MSMSNINELEYTKKLLALGGLFAIISGAITFGRYELSQRPKIEISDDFLSSVRCDRGAPNVSTTTDAANRLISVEISCRL